MYPSRIAQCSCTRHTLKRVFDSYRRLFFSRQVEAPELSVGLLFRFELGGIYVSGFPSYNVLEASPQCIGRNHIHSPLFRQSRTIFLPLKPLLTLLLSDSHRRCIFLLSSRNSRIKRRVAFLVLISEVKSVRIPPNFWLEPDPQCIGTTHIYFPRFF